MKLPFAKFMPSRHFLFIAYQAIVEIFYLERSKAFDVKIMVEKKKDFFPLTLPKQDVATPNHGARANGKKEVRDKYTVNCGG